MVKHPWIDGLAIGFVLGLVVGAALVTFFVALR